MTRADQETLAEACTEKARYWRREGQYVEVAIAVGDSLTAEYGREANATALLLERSSAAIRTDKEGAE